MPNPANPADTTTAATPKDPLVEERERAREIRALGRQFNMAALSDEAIDKGTSVDAFRQLVITKLQDNGSLRAAESPEIGMSNRDVENYSFCRAMLAASDPANAAKLAPFELECSRAAQDKRDSSDTRSKERQTAITIPPDVLARGIGLSNEAAQAAARQLQARASAMYRDLVVGTATAGGNLVATELLGSSFIDLLRNAMILDRMGITWLRDLNGNVAIPRATGAASYYFVAENGAPTESQQSFDQVTFTPKTIGAFTDFSRRLLLQSSLDVEAFVRTDIALQIAQGMQYAALLGSGASNEPTGLLNISGIGSVALGTNGAAPDYNMAVDLESAVANANADVGNLSYLTNTKVRGKLRKTQEFSGTNGKAVWQSGRDRGVGELLGYDAYVTNTMPSNLTKGTSSGVCSAAVFGNWSDLVIAMWGGLDIMLDPYVGATTGARRVIALQDFDVNVRRVSSFAAVKDILTT